MIKASSKAPTTIRLSWTTGGEEYRQAVTVPVGGTGVEMANQRRSQKKNKNGERE